MASYVSRYLNVYPSHRGTMLLFHGVTGAIDEVEAEFGRRLKSQQRLGTPLGGEFGDEMVDFLRKRGHLTELPPDEEWKNFREYVTKLHEDNCESYRRSGNLMLVASYYCNLACAYCYQNPMRKAEGEAATNVMTPETVDDIFTKVFDQLFPGVERKSRVSINLYGGEPFLERNRPALERILHYTQMYQITVSAISNASALGGFLDCFGMEQGLVNSLQISFDGAKLMHDKSRITHYGGGTFDAIVANIHELLDRGVRLNLRVNTSRFNVDSLPLLWEQLAAEEITSHPNATIYAAAIHSHFDQVDGIELFSPAILSKQIENKGIPIRSPLCKKKSRLEGVFAADDGIPLTRTHFCMQNMPQAFLIDHRRDIYSCYEEAGNRRLAVGSFDAEGKVALGDRYTMYQSRHVGMYEPCSTCSVALTCGGGCPVAARGANFEGSIFTNYCDSHKELVAMGIQKLFQEKVSGLPRETMAEDRFAREQPYL